MSCFAPATGFGLGCTTIIDLFMTHDGLRIPRILNFPLTCRHGRRIFQNILNTYVLRMVKSVKWTLCPPTESTARGEHQTRLLWTISAVHCNLKERLHSHSTVTPQSLHSHSTHIPPCTRNAGDKTDKTNPQIISRFFPFFSLVSQGLQGPCADTSVSFKTCPVHRVSTCLSLGSAGSPPQRRAWRLAPRSPRQDV